MTVLVNCPSCRHVRQVPDHDVCLGVMCPYCHGAFMDAIDRPRGAVEGGRQSLSSSSYEVDVGQWFSYAGAHWTALLGPAIGFLLVEMAGLLAIAIVAYGMELATSHAFPGIVVGTLLAVVAMPLLEAGVIIVTLAQLKGDRWTFADFFAGFGARWRWPILAFTWMIVGLLLVILVPVWVPMLIGWAIDVPHLVWFGVAAAVVFVPAAVYVGVRIGFFGPYLIIDRDFRPLEALQESWDLTTGHFWGLFGVTLLLAAAVAGAVAFLPVVLVLPLTALVRTAGYLLAGGTRPPMKQPERR